MISRIARTYRESFSGLSKEIWTLSAVILVNRSSSMAVPFMSLYMTQYLHRPPSDAGLIITLFGLGAILGATAGGKLTDMVGFRTIQVLSSIIGGAFFIVFSSLTNFHLLCIFTLLISFFSEAFKPANFAAIAVYAKEGTATRSDSLNRLASNLGFAVGSSMGGIIASFSYPALFIVDGAVSIAAGVFIYFLLPEVRKLISGSGKTVSDEPVRMPWNDVLFMQFLLLTLLLTTCFYLMFRVVPLFYKEVLHLDEFMIGVVLGMNGLIIALFEMVMISKIQHKRSPVNYIIRGVLCIVLSYLVLLLPVYIPLLLALLSVALFTVGEMFALPFINAFVISRSNEFNRGQYAAGYTISWSAAQVLGPSAGFYLAEHYGYHVLWVVLILLLLCCAAGFHLLGRKMTGTS
jgi:predicted MFS family arabinose efflux permease